MSFAIFIFTFVKVSVGKCGLTTTMTLIFVIVRPSVFVLLQYPAESVDVFYNIMRRVSQCYSILIK